MNIRTAMKVSMIALVAGGLMTGCGSMDGWKKMSIDGATVSFEMPEPIKMNEDAKEGVVVYAAQKGKMSFKVGITKRNYEQDQQQGKSDEQVLTTFAQRTIQASQQQFQQMNLKAEFKNDGAFQVPTGVGQQYEATVGKALVLDRFYINKQGLYFVEVTTQDPQSPDVKRFLDSFTP